MSGIAYVNVRVDASDKKIAETILRELGVTPSCLIQMLYKQVINTRGIPFEIRLPAKPIATGDMTEKEIADLIKEGIDSTEEGTLTAEEVHELLKNVWWIV